MNREIEALAVELFKKVIRVTASAPLKKGGYKKILLRPVVIKGEELFQAERYTEKQVFHSNIKRNEIAEWFCANCDGYKQYVFMTKEENVTALCSIKGAVKIIRSKAENKEGNEENDRAKEYILEENMPIAVLTDLGIYDKNGKPIKAMNKKLRQIDRFIRIIAETLKDFEKDEITVLDFGCGKSYLTFLCYHYLKNILQKEVKVYGYDLDEKTVKLCNGLAEKYGFDGIRFATGDVTGKDLYNDNVDLIMSLHACDTATDATLLYAIKHNVKYLLSVPCCQHEVNLSIHKNGDFDFLLDNGIIKDRFCALLTDSVRAEIMKRCGYETDVFEFVEFAHSPKNLMLRCKRKKVKKAELADIKKLLDKYGAKQSLVNGLTEFYK